MSWWLTVELLIAAVIVVIACRKRQYWLGGALVFLLWPLFGWLVPSQDSMMYALPFVLARLSTFALTANFFRGETPRDGVICRESSRIASRNAV